MQSFSRGVNSDQTKIANLLNQNVEEVFIRESLEAKLRSGKRLRVKLGFDPTGDKIHIGRAVILWKLREFQDLGHEIIFIIGDFTALIGDPSDKLEKRPMLTKEMVEKNLKGYKEQVGKIIDLKRAKFFYNSKWLSKLGFGEICELAESFSVQQMSNRRNFKERLEKGIEVSLREFLYPLMQGYDSVAVNADVEIGGFDQLFNLKAGRVIQKHYRKPEQDILTTKMLIGTDGRKMSTSWGNVINITDPPNEMFGKTMSLRDDLITSYFSLCALAGEEEVEKISERLEGGENPRDIKIELAKKITALYHGKESAEKAAERFISLFSEKKIPEDVLVVSVAPETSLADVLLQNKLIASKTEFRRLASENAITEMESGTEITDPNFKVTNNMVLKIGKKRFVKITLNA